MTIKQLETGKWQVNIQPGGRAGRRVKKSFSTKAAALAWERHIHAKAQTTPDWAPTKKDTRRLSELCEIWFRNHGSSLRAGNDTYRRLLALVEAMGNPIADTFSADVFATYRAKRIDAGITPNNMNREHSYLRAVFNELIRLDLWTKENPLKKLRAFKIQEIERKYLDDVQIKLLLSELKKSTNPHVELVSRICLATGARWGEAESLQITQVKNGLIQFVQTKSSKNRAVPISTDLQAALKTHHESHGQNSRLFTTATSAFREALERANLKLQTGQLTHILRHTFASHFMMNGGNILVLQRALGHQSLAMTMKYAHLSPEHLAETVQLNPLSWLKLG